MKILPLSSAGLLFVVMGSLFGAACGSEVDGGGGSSSSATSASVGGDPITLDQACNDFCHKLETLNCSLGGGGDCGTQCTDQTKDVPPECEAAMTALYMCYTDNAQADCDQPMACADEEDTVQACIKMYGCANDGCFGGQGMNGESSCGCDDTCKGTKYSTNCTTPAGGGMTTCDCLVDEMSVGTCTQTDTDGCGTKDSCCNAQYFKL
jgi:hypothetical protein